MNAAKGPISHTTSQKHNFALTIFVLLFKKKTQKSWQQLHSSVSYSIVFSRVSNYHNFFICPLYFSGSFYDTEMGRISGSFEPSFFAPIFTAPETSSLGGKNSKLKEEETIKTMTLAYPLHSVILFKGYGRLKEEDFFYVYWSMSLTKPF